MNFHDFNIRIKNVNDIIMNDTKKSPNPKSYGLYDLVTHEQVSQTIIENPDLMDFSDISKLINGISKSDITSFLKKYHK